MKNMSLQDCTKIRDGKSYCAILVSEDTSFFVPVLVGESEGTVLMNFMLGEDIPDEELDRLLFIPESWRQLDSNLVAVELDYDNEEGIIVARTCMHQKNEVCDKFCRVVTPIGYALIYAEHFGLPLYVDDRITAQDGREIQRLESYLKHI